jgi:hypothetical protein
MKWVLLIVAIFAFGSAVAADESTIIGTIYNLARNQVSVKTARGSFMNPADDRTVTVKDKSYPGLSSLNVGDEVSIRCQTSTGKRIAVKVFANIITFSGTVRHVGDQEIEVLTIPNADYSREEHRLVHLYPDTVFGASRKELSVGQDVRVVGLDVGNGAVDASRVAIYNMDVPVKKGPRK